MQHLEKTPNEYIRWRYAIGEDRENLSKVTRKVSTPLLLTHEWAIFVAAALTRMPGFSCCIPWGVNNLKFENTELLLGTLEIGKVNH